MREQLANSHDGAMTVHNAAVEIGFIHPAIQF
jgi:hypothetical protein